MLNDKNIMKNKIALNATLIVMMLVNFVSGQSSLNYIGQEKLYYGVAYYPESWELETVDEDIRLMKQANINVVRMSEFAWSMMEPEEGNYQFNWLVDVIKKLKKADIDVVLGTPSATPPVWLSRKHPEIYVVRSDGSKKGPGARRNVKYNSRIYNQYVEKICLELSKAVQGLDGVIGWQTDNEFHLTSDYSEETKKDWHEWLKTKYSDIESLNAIWATELWSQHYDSFEDVPLDNSPDIWHHTSLRYEWALFCNHQVVKFQDIQLKAIRTYSDAPITHDAMPGQNLDYPKLFENLDFVATNFYHNFSAYNRVQSNYDRIRAYNKKMHWVFETAPNHSGGGPKGNTWFIHQPEGSVKAIIWLNYALAGQGTVFWLWRQHRAGQEMPHGAFISAWGKPMANFEELSELGKELRDNSDLLMEYAVEPAEIGLFYSHKADMGLRIEQTYNGLRYYTDWTSRFYRPLSDAFLHRDVVNEYSDLSNYKVLAAPMLPNIDEGLNQKLKAFVVNGGVLLLGPMSGYRSKYWTANTSSALGIMNEWTNLEVEYRLPIDNYNKDILQPMTLELQPELFKDLNTGTTDLWTESILINNGEKVLASYNSGYLKNRPAIVEKAVGKGKVVYIGTDPGYDAMKQIYLHYSKEVGVTSLATGDKDVVVVPRIKKGDKPYYFIVNLTKDEKEINFKTKISNNLLNNRKFLINEVDSNNWNLKLEPFGVYLVKEL